MRLFLINLLRRLPLPFPIRARLSNAYWDALLTAKESAALLDELAAEAMAWHHKQEHKHDL